MDVCARDGGGGGERVGSEVFRVPNVAWQPQECVVFTYHAISDLLHNINIFVYIYVYNLCMYMYKYNIYIYIYVYNIMYIYIHFYFGIYVCVYV